MSERETGIAPHLLNAEFGRDAAPRRVASGLLAVCTTHVYICVRWGNANAGVSIEVAYLKKERFEKKKEHL